MLSLACREPGDPASPRGPETRIRCDYEPRSRKAGVGMESCLCRTPGRGFRTRAVRFARLGPRRDEMRNDDRGPRRRSGCPPERSSKLSSPTSAPLEEIEVDLENLYLEEVFTDLKVATIRRLSPVKVDGSQDETRPVLFHAQTQLMSQMGAASRQLCDRSRQPRRSDPEIPRGHRSGHRTHDRRSQGDAAPGILSDHRSGCDACGKQDQALLRAKPLGRGLQIGVRRACGGWRGGCACGGGAIWGSLRATRLPRATRVPIRSSSGSEV